MKTLCHKINTLIFDSPKDQALHAARIICDNYLQSIHQERMFLLGCPAGRSPLEIYKEMANILHAQQLDLSRLTLVMMDEYVTRKDGHYQYVDQEEHFSCRKFAYDQIMDVFNEKLKPAHQIKKSQIWFPDPHHPDQYDQKIKKAGGIDQFIVAVGARDGHIAFNPSGSSLHSPTRIIELSYETRCDNMETFNDFKHLFEVPEFGVSIGLRSILKESKNILMVIHGAHKANIVQKLFELDDFTESWPMSLIYKARDKSTLLVDRAAYSKVKE